MRTAVTVAGDLVRDLVAHKGLLKGKLVMGGSERAMFWHRNGRFTQVRATQFDLRTKQTPPS